MELVKHVFEGIGVIAVVLGVIFGVGFWLLSQLKPGDEP